jgi:hypothetical protein
VDLSKLDGKFSRKGREYWSNSDGKQATPPCGADEVGRKT